MAYMNQERKAVLAAELKKAMAGYGLKYTLRVHHNSTIIMNITEGPFDFFKNANDILMPKLSDQQLMNRRGPVEKSMQVNVYWINEHFSGACKSVLMQAKAALMTGNHDRSDVQSDYFDVGFYVSINIGAWDKPYKLTVR